MYVEILERYSLMCTFALSDSNLADSVEYVLYLCTLSALHGT
jgi:hypothetical protein